jgi:LCP family protein required for cell wall assembly
MQRTPALIIGAVVLVVAAIVAFFLAGTPNEPQPSPSPDASPSPSGSLSPSPSPTLSAELLDRRWTVLYVGTDVNEGRAGAGQPVNTDALMLVSLSADQSRLTLISLPRDTVDVPLPDGGTYRAKINGLYREQGMDALVGAMEALYEVPIDAHLLLDMDDFARLIEAVDGVDVAPEAPLTDPAADLDLPAGAQHIDAATALGYVRTRVDQDYGRMARQQEVLQALVARMVDPDTELDLEALLDGLVSMETDLPLDELPTLVELARRAADAQVETLVIEPPLIAFEGNRGDGRGYVLDPDVEAIRAEVQRLIAD